MTRGLLRHKSIMDPARPSTIRVARDTLGGPMNFDRLDAPPALYARLVKQMMAHAIDWGLAYPIGSTLV